MAVPTRMARNGAGRCWPGSNNTGTHGLDLDRLVAGLLNYVGEVGDGFAAAAIINLVPFEVVGAFGVVLIIARNQDVVAQDFTLALDDVGEAPSVTDLN